MSSQKKPKTKKKTRTETRNNNLELKTCTNDLEKDMEACISRYKGSILGTSANVINKTENSYNNNNNNDTAPSKDEEKSNNLNNNLKSEDLQKQLEECKAKIKKEKQEFIEEVSLLNSQLSENQKNINLLSKNNSEFMSKLRNIQKVIDINMKNAKIYKIKKTEMNKGEKQIKNNILVKDEEIINENKRWRILKTEINKLQKLLQESKSNSEIILISELNQLNQISKNLQLEIKNLKKIANEHKLCANFKINILTQKNIFDNEYQFMLKKMKMNGNNNSAEDEYYHTSNNSKNKNYNSSININKKSGIFKKYKIKNNLYNRDKCLTVNKSEFLSCNSKLSLNNKQDLVRKLDKITLNQINNKINLMSELQIRALSEVSNSITESKEYNNNKPKNLFSNNEFELLNQIIPGKYLNTYKERYDYLESQKIEVGKKFNENKKIKKKISTKKEMIDFSRLQNKEKSKVALNLKIELNKYNKIILQLNEKIKEINKNIKIQKNTFRIKNKENKELIKNLEEIRNKIGQKRKMSSENYPDKEDEA